MTKPKTVKLRLTRSEAPATDIKPFIIDHEKLNDPYKELDKEDGFDPLSSKVPINKELLELGDQFREALPELMGKKMTSMRNFFLREMTPLLLASSNGLKDANEILKNALGEDPETNPYFRRLEAMLNVALEVRMLDFISSYTGLNKPQRQMLTYLLFSKEGGNDGSVQSKLLEMLKVPDVQGQPVKGETKKQNPSRRRPTRNSNRSG